MLVGNYIQYSSFSPQGLNFGLELDSMNPTHLLRIASGVSADFPKCSNHTSLSPRYHLSTLQRSSFRGAAVLTSHHFLGLAIPFITSPTAPWLIIRLSHSYMKAESPFEDSFKFTSPRRESVKTKTIIDFRHRRITITSGGAHSRLSGTAMLLLSI